jgi:hypothetical protein
MTGHMVLSTLHTNDAIGTPPAGGHGVPRYMGGDVAASGICSVCFA